MKSLRHAGVMVILASFVYAQSAYDAIHILEKEIGFGTRALALGGAYTAVADDYSAIYWNPAGLGLMKEPSIFGELSHLNFTNRALYATQETTDSQRYTRFRSIGVAYPLPTSRGSFVLAMGYNAIVNFDENLLFSGYSSQVNGLGFDITDDKDIIRYYAFDKDVHRAEQMSTEGGLRQWSLGGAVALSPHFMLGITAAYLEGKERYKLRFTQEDSQDQYDQYPGDFDRYTVNQILESDYGTWSLKLGGLVHFDWGLNIGGVMTIPSSFRVLEVHSSSDELIFDDGYVDTTEDNGRWDYRVSTPYHFDGGLSLRIAFITVAGSFRYRDWSQTRFVVLKHRLGDADYREFLDENDEIRLDYRPTVEYHLGGEIALEKLRTTVRGGYALYPSPVKDAVRNQDRQFVTGGVSFALDRYIHLDITYLHGMWEREVWDRYTPGGTVEDITEQKLLIGLSYQF